MSLDISCNALDESELECFAGEILNDVCLVPTFEFTGDSVVLGDGTNLLSEKTPVDFDTQAALTVYSGERTKEYKVRFYPYTGLPYISIATADGREVTDKNNDRDASIRIMENPDNLQFGDLMECTIIGHGNSTWETPKKPYAIMFDKKTSLLSMPKGKSWILLANYYDKTMVRNATAMYLSSLSRASYTPRSRFFELILNGKHRGTYQLFEKINKSKQRLDLDDDDFLMEVDNHPRAKDIYFVLDSVQNKVKIHSPEVSVGDEDYEYINKVMNEIEDTLFSVNFLDEKTGYKKYFDFDALVEWFVVTEITENSSNRGNWYMVYEHEGKLKMGPFWDYDLAFGNSLWVTYANEIDRIYMPYIPWFRRFMEDPEFKNKSAERLSYFYDYKADILKKVDEAAEKIRASVVVNNKLWNMFECDSCSKEQVLNLYDEELSKMKTWIDARMESLKSQFDSFVTP